MAHQLTSSKVTHSSCSNGEFLRLIDAPHPSQIICHPCFDRAAQKSNECVQQVEKHTLAGTCEVFSVFPEIYNIMDEICSPNSAHT